MPERILLVCLWCMVASSLLSAWNGRSIFFQAIISIFLEFISIFKIFGIAFAILFGLGSGIVLWEQVISRSQIWKKLSARPCSPNSCDESVHPHVQDNDQPEEQKSVLPLVLVLTGLAIFVSLESSIGCPSNQEASPKRPPAAPQFRKVNSHKNVFQFSLAIITLALVVGFIVFNKDEYRAWKARRRLYKHNRRTPRQEISLQSPRR